MSERNPAAGVVMIIGGVVVFSQVVLGDLFGRLMTYASPEALAADAAGARSTDARGFATNIRDVATGKSGAALVAVLMTQKHDTYHLGGKQSPKTGFDCSGFIQWGMGKLGVANFPRTAAAQIAHCRPISVGRALHKPGALVFHGPEGISGITGHIACCIGDGVHTIEAHSTADGVGVFDGRNRFSQGGLIPELSYGLRGNRARGVRGGVPAT